MVPLRTRGFSVLDPFQTLSRYWRIPNTGSQFEKSLVPQRLIVGDPILISWSPCVRADSRFSSFTKYCAFQNRYHSVRKAAIASDSAPFAAGNCIRHAHPNV